MSDFNWRCPHCERHVTISSGRFSTKDHILFIPNRTGNHGLRSQFIVCPNPECGKYTLTVFLQDTVSMPGQEHKFTTLIDRWKLVPWGESRAFPDYVPQAIRDDYVEACSIVELSPKAAATLARRAVQGIVRGFWQISKNTLNQELLELANHIGASITQETWDSIDAIRSVGNIGAHMERDINIIVDVDPEEAELLIELVETLIEDTYVASHDRQQRHAKLVALKTKKQDEKKGPATQES